MAIICNRCKTENKETNNYCVNCGELLKEDFLDYNSLQKNYSELQSIHKELQMRYDSSNILDKLTQENYSSLQENYNSLQESYSSLQESYSSLKKDHILLQANYSSLEKNNSSLQAKNSSLEINNSSLQAKNSSLEINNSSLQAKNNSLERNNSSLQAKNSSLEINNSSLQAKNSSLKKDNSSLRKRNRINFLIIVLLIIATGAIYYWMQEDIDYYTFSSNRNYNEAFKWYQKAVESKATFAPNDSIEDMNWGGKVNYDSIAEYKKAAEQGNIFAQYTLGELYTEGFLDCPEDTNMAIELLNGSIEKEFAPAITKYGEILFSKQKLQERLEWYNKAALIGYAPAENYLGVNAKDDNQAFKWYSKSAHHGYHWGEYNLGLCFFRGEGTSLDMDSAKYWLMRAASKQNSSAENQIGIIYYIANNIQEAIKWWEKSGSRGNSWAYYNLGEIYRDGDGIEKDLERAKDYFKKSAELGNDSSKVILEKLLLPNDSILPLNKKVSNYWEKIKNKIKSLF